MTGFRLLDPTHIWNRVFASGSMGEEAIRVVLAPSDSTGSVTTIVEVANFPVSQTVDGTVAVSNFPATQTVDGTVNIGNFPATQQVAGTVQTTQASVTTASIPAGVNVNNFPVSYPITQFVVASPLNSSTGSLAAGASFVGTGESTLGVVGIQVSLHADQNCTVFIDQSPDNINWDINDQFNYFEHRNDFGVTVQAINSYCRVRVQNVGAGATTTFRLQTALCPVASPLPRSLTALGNLKAGIREIADHYGFEAENTPLGELRTVTPFRLVGSGFSNGLDPNFWGSSTGTSGTASVANAQLSLFTGIVSNNPVAVQSFRTARYVTGTTLNFRGELQTPDLGVTNNVRRWGAFTTTDGAFFLLSGSVLSVGTRKTGVDTLVHNGIFNGDLGSTLVPPLSSASQWEIYWTTRKLYFTLNDMLLHTIDASGSTWADTMNLPARFESQNYNGLSSNRGMYVRSAAIMRLGAADTLTTSYHITTGSVNLKIGPGQLKRIIINNSTAALITLADALSGTVPAIAIVNPVDKSVPVTLDYDCPFFTGLTVTATALTDLTVVYE